jgi:hypothetical protein
MSSDKPMAAYESPHPRRQQARMGHFLGDSGCVVRWLSHFIAGYDSGKGVLLLQ